jgi:hypothetical protein
MDVLVVALSLAIRGIGKGGWWKVWVFWLVSGRSTQDSEACKFLKWNGWKDLREVSFLCRRQGENALTFGLMPQSSPELTRLSSSWLPLREFHSESSLEVSWPTSLLVVPAKVSLGSMHRMNSHKPFHGVLENKEVWEVRWPRVTKRVIFENQNKYTN